jgi:hypothetical protein
MLFHAVLNVPGSFPGPLAPHEPLAPLWVAQLFSSTCITVPVTVK